MSLNDLVEAIPRKTMTLFFLIDTSGSMAGSKIGAVNAAIEEVLPELKDISAANADAEVKIAALEFSHTANWITVGGPLPVNSFLWRHLNAGGVTALGDACKKLNDALSTKTFMREAVGSFAPAIFLLSDGEPTDDFAAALGELKKNNWFKAAIKAAVAIGDDANKTKLADFTGTPEAVLEVHNGAELRKMVKFVSVRASQVASKSVQVSSVPLPSPSAGDGATPDPIASVTKQAALNEQLVQIKMETANSEDDEW